MRLARLLPAALICILPACGDRDAPQAKAAVAASTGQMTYAACMEAANQRPSRAETVMKAAECMRLPDAPPPGSTLPPGVPPPPAAPAGGAIRSVYTSLAPEQCRVIRRHEETGGSVSRCPGVAGHALLVSEDDARMSVDVVTPDGGEHPLNYWSVVTRGFSTLGPRAEWRVRGEGGQARPVALIVRVNAAEDPDNPERTTSYLAVAKITPREVCVTNSIAPAADANEQARRAADASAGRPCAPEAGMR